MGGYDYFNYGPGKEEKPEKSDYFLEHLKYDIPAIVAEGGYHLSDDTSKPDSKQFLPVMRKKKRVTGGGC